jgi:hypothetical protein
MAVKGFARPSTAVPKLDLVREADGSVRVIDGEALIAEAHSVPGVDVEVPAPVSPDEARAAAARFALYMEGELPMSVLTARVDSR